MLCIAQLIFGPNWFHIIFTCGSLEKKHIQIKFVTLLQPHWGPASQTLDFVSDASCIAALLQGRLSINQQPWRRYAAYNILHRPPFCETCSSPQTLPCTSPNINHFREDII